MLSISHNFLFVHIPKTAGNSIQNILQQYSDDKIVCEAPHHDGRERFTVRHPDFRTRKHSSLKDYREQYGEEIFNRLYKFACVRNPWDRVVSYYFSPNHGRTFLDKTAFIREIDKVPLTSSYLALTGQVQDMATVVKNVDYIMRFEDLNADFKTVCRELQIDQQELPVRNKSNRENYRSYYDQETMEFVARRFADEISYFGYTF